MKNAEAMVDKMMETVQKGLSGKEKEEMRELIEQVFVEEIPPKKALGVSDQDEEGLYNYAYHLYDTGKYEEALQVFKVLLTIDIKNSKHAMGLAASYHMLKNYDRAIHGYLLAINLEPTNPLPLYHLSDCYHKKGDLAWAIASLEMAHEIASKHKAYHKLKERIEVLLAGLEKEEEKELES